VSSQWVTTEKGKYRNERREVNTSPEVELRRAARAAGGRCRLHQQIAGTAPGLRLAGAAWHVLREHISRTKNDLPKRLVSASLGADLNPCPDVLSPAAYAFEEQLVEEKAVTLTS